MTTPAPVPAALPVNADFVTALRELLAAAEQGAITGGVMALLGPQPGGGAPVSVSTVLTGAVFAHAHMALGGLRMAEHRMVSDCFTSVALGSKTPEDAGA